MPQISKKLIICLTSILLIVTCASCKTDAPYLIKDYLNYLAKKSGIGNSQMIETNFEDLLTWEIVEEEDKELLEDELNYVYVEKTINALLSDTNKTIDDLEYDKLISKEKVESLVDQAVEIINHQTFETSYEYTLKDNEDIYYDEQEDKYKYKNSDETTDPQFEEVFSSFDVSSSFTVDFSDAQIIPYEDETDDTAYLNNKYNLLASKNHVFNKDGFRISYTLNSAGISVHVSKDINGMNVFGDLDIKNVKPSFKWTYKENDLKNCYFNLSFNSSEQFGVSTGKYAKYYLKLKDLDSSSFSNAIKSMLVKEKDKSEAIIPICQIKTPLPNIPNAYINFDILLKFSVNGKIELLINNKHNFGFEIKEGKSRFFYDHDDDFDAIARASGKACLGLNVGVDAVNYRLCDAELDGGLKAVLQATLHMYDSQGNLSSSQADLEYSVLEELSKDNPNVKVCGDLSFYWLFDVILNTSKSVLYKMGFTKTFHILDEDNQVFGNLHHIEDGQFVSKCTRKSLSTNKSSGKVGVSAYDKITLNSYAEVLSINETFNIEVEGLPSGYKESDLRYCSLNEGVASVNNARIKANNYGNAKIKVYTKDNKYNTYINILVSTG